MAIEAKPDWSKGVPLCSLECSAFSEGSCLNRQEAVEPGVVCVDWADGVMRLLRLQLQKTRLAVRSGGQPGLAEFLGVLEKLCNGIDLEDSRRRESKAKVRELMGSLRENLSAQLEQAGVVMPSPKGPEASPRFAEDLEPVAEEVDDRWDA